MSCETTSSVTYTPDSIRRQEGAAGAQRLERYAHVVGREQVIAGLVCGLATFAAAPPVVPAIAWAKRGALVEGARIASQKL